MGKSLEQKIMYSAIAAAIFALVSLPQVYEYTSSYLRGVRSGCPDMWTKIFHALVFLILNFLIMKAFNEYSAPHEKRDDMLLFKYSLYGTFIFYIIADDNIYKITNQLAERTIGVRLANSDGCPNASGIGAHSVVYFLIVLGMMHLPQ